MNSEEMDPADEAVPEKKRKKQSKKDKKSKAAAEQEANTEAERPKKKGFLPEIIGSVHRRSVG